MSPAGKMGRLDAGFHDLLKKEAAQRKTSMMKLQKNLLKNIPATPLDLFANDENFIKRKK